MVPNKEEEVQKVTKFFDHLSEKLQSRTGTQAPEIRWARTMIEEKWTKMMNEIGCVRTVEALQAVKEVLKPLVVQPVDKYTGGALVQ